MISVAYRNGMSPAITTRTNANLPIIDFTPERSDHSQAQIAIISAQIIEKF
jgi:hypothetical protein